MCRPRSLYIYLYNHPYFLGKTGFILLSRELWRRRPIEKAIVIAHEVAHAVNENKRVKYEGSIVERRIKMEEEANELAIKWLVKPYKKERLQQISNIDTEFSV